jgi:hypothetical protein
MAWFPYYMRPEEEASNLSLSFAIRLTQPAGGPGRLRRASKRDVGFLRFVFSVPYRSYPARFKPSDQKHKPFNWVSGRLVWCHHRGHISRACGPDIMGNEGKKGISNGINLLSFKKELFLRQQRRSMPQCDAFGLFFFDFFWFLHLAYGRFAAIA